MASRVSKVLIVHTHPVVTRYPSFTRAMAGSMATGLRKAGVDVRRVDLADRRCACAPPPGLGRPSITLATSVSNIMYATVKRSARACSRPHSNEELSSPKLPNFPQLKHGGRRRSLFVIGSQGGRNEATLLAPR